jgi:hypothetical protein
MIFQGKTTSNLPIAVKTNQVIPTTILKHAEVHSTLNSHPLLTPTHLLITPKRLAKHPMVNVDVMQKVPRYNVANFASLI